MKSEEFSNIRHYLGKSQSQLAILLSISTKSVQSFEQGWRKIPINIEKQMLYLLAMERAKNRSLKPCWQIKKCPTKLKSNCAAWKLKAGYICWYLNGTFCEGQDQLDWPKKLRICRQCEVFKRMLPDF